MLLSVPRPLKYTKFNRYKCVCLKKFWTEFKLQPRKTLFVLTPLVQVFSLQFIIINFMFHFELMFVFNREEEFEEYFQDMFL